MCAIEAGRRGRRVLVLDHAERPGKKILISGGGRCNFTNRHCKPENFLSTNPHFAKSALARYTPSNFLALVEKHGIAWHEKKLGQLFCDRSAQEILTMLLTEAAEAGVTIRCNMKVLGVRRTDAFEIDCETASFRSASLVVATGGLSIPKMGATSLGYDIAQQFGIGVIEPRPALVPLVFGREESDRFCDLSGVSTDVIASIGPRKFSERMLVTHRGMSGPAILQISSYWNGTGPVTLDMAPGQKLAAMAQERRDERTLLGKLRLVLPHRLLDRLLELDPPSGWSNQALEDWERRWHSWKIVPETTEGFAKAEVTAGGVDTAFLSAKTMESRVPGLFFIGEVVDVTGHLGGFNFQWAWASGAAAGRAV